LSGGDEAVVVAAGSADLEVKFISRIRFLSVSAAATPCFTFVLNIRLRSASSSTIKKRVY
jgi:hypothetical protein